MQIPFFKRGARIDLTTNKVSIESLDDYYYTRFLGGKGLGAALLYNNLPPFTDAMSPQNVIIFLTGPLTASGFPCSSRGVMVTKSPLTGTFLDSNIGGFFGKALKKTGFDYIIIEGRSKKPVWVDINGEQVEFNDASKLWGLSTSATNSALKEELKTKEVEVLAIGPAGEHKVLFASISCDGRMFGRGGGGAVMGSKQLKAISLRGSKELPWFSSKLFRKEIKNARGKLIKNPLTQKGGAFKKFGTTFTLEVTQGAGVLPTHNWQYGTFKEARKLFADKFFERKIKSATCFQCPIGCSRVVETLNEKQIRAKGPEYETIYAFGSNCGIDNPDTIIEADRLCENYGLDTISCGGAIAFLMECTEKKIFLGNGQGEQIRFGDSEGLLATIRMIAKRDGIGNYLAEGAYRLSELLGPNTNKYSMCVKGLELPGYDPRGMKGMALLYATSDRGGCHLRGSTLRSELLGLPQPIDRFGYSGKAKLAADLQKGYTVMNIISECLFASFALTIDDYTAALNSLYENNLNSRDLLNVGKRVWDTTRSFNCREGFSSQDDNLPPRLFEDPIPHGPSKNQVVDKGEFENMKKEYYRIQGWDENTGKPLNDPTKNAV